LIFADILEYLQSLPAQEFKKNELLSALQINSSARTIDRAFSKLNNDPRIRVTKRGSFNTYQWEEDTPAKVVHSTFFKIKRMSIKKLYTHY
jgi:hypothetical protein